MRKSQWNKAYLGIADTGPDNTRYIWVSRNNGQKARRYWLFGVRRADAETEAGPVGDAGRHREADWMAHE